MARTRKKKTRRRTNPATLGRGRIRRRAHRRRTQPVTSASNPRRRYSRRRRIASHRRRRNPTPTWLTGTARNVVGVLGGATLTKVLSERLPFGLNQGIAGYIGAGVVSVLQGWAIGKFSKSKALGDAMILGGFVYVGLRVIQDFLPALSGYSPFGLKGMGLISPSQGFPTPLVPVGNSMTSFVTPGYLPTVAVVQPGMSGLGRRQPRVGRLA